MSARRAFNNTRIIAVSRPTRTFGSQRTLRSNVFATNRLMRSAIPSRQNLLRLGGQSTVMSRRHADRIGFPEKKTVDLAIANYQANSTAVFTLLNGSAEGVGITQHVGRRVNLKSTYIRGHVTIENAAIGTVDIFSQTQLVRAMLVMDWQPNQATAVAAELFTDPTTPAHSQLNLDNRERFSVLWDKTWALGPLQTTTASGVYADNCCRAIKKYKKLNLQCVYDATAGATIASITTGALYLVTCGSNAPGTGTDSVVFVSVRTRFTDV